MADELLCYQTHCARVKGNCMIKTNRGYLITAGIFVATLAALLLMGREPICKCGTIKLWHGIVFSSENSQHISDWYTPSHVIHGIVFFGAAHIVLRRAQIGWKLVFATLIECAWEIVENTDTVIQRYREATIALDYFGDSVINSAADIIAMWVGFFLASRLPVWLTVVLALSMEAVTVAVIRDGLVLNVIMLLWPLDAVRDWQSAI